MDWNGFIDGYCERLAPGLLGEPVNAVTNLAFFVAAAYGVRLARRHGDRGVLVLAGIAAVIGTGSLLFHTAATRWALLADVIPIAVFIAVAFGLVLRRLLGFSPLVAAVGAALFMAASPAVGALVAPLVGSGSGYVAPLLAMAVIGAGLALRHRPGGGPLLCAAAVFAVSLTLRTLDEPLCSAFPLGTHGGWHVLNAVVLALVMRALGGRGAARGG
ncbi:ceramidase domain-containing protein [Methylobrevis albus]|uniref:Ceramidase domain-containing protein n=1 Tax=Methylobrevis albus TaxID=2793297 RepID=A0A931I3C8_9HYPH|nr:ceramidase domain-containing protein [Methylobrevis albus]MBH0238146.1 ceramidase domain-containing protein [Methylobrevis albus]